MNGDASLLSFLHHGHPARLNGGQAAKLLGFADHDVPVLVATGLLRPLGNPAPNAPKYFALVDVLDHAADRDWLNRATRSLSKHWQRKNEEQRGKRGERVEADDLPEAAKLLSAKVSADGAQK